MNDRIATRRTVLLLLFACWILACRGSAFAQSTGKIMGVVTDAETDDPLPGVNVVVTGLQIGAATDSEGNYVILNVPVGEHNVVASMVGYVRVTKAEVLVTVDQTSRVNFALQPATIEGEEITVVAERPIIHTEVSGSQQVITAEEMLQAPAARSVEDFLSKQVGISDNLGIRGGSTDQTGTIVNGFMFTNDRFGTPDASIPLSAIEQVSVKSGGFNAEHGNFRSGLIDLTTKTGASSRYSGRVDLSRNKAHMKRFGPSLYAIDNYYLRHELDPSVAFVGTEQAWADDPYARGQHQSFAGWNSLAEEYNQGKPAEEQVTPLDLYLWDAWVHMVEPPFEELESLGFQISEDVRQQFRRHRHPGEGSSSDWNVDVGFGGPVPVVGRYLGDATFYVSHRSAEDHYIQPVTRPSVEQHTTMLTLQSRLSSRFKLTLNGINRVERGVLDVVKSHHFPAGLGRMMPADNIVDNIADQEQYLYFPEIFTPKDEYTRMVGVELRHTVSARTFWKLGVSGEFRGARAAPPWADAGIGWNQFFEEGYYERSNEPLITFGPIKVNEQPYGFSAGNQVVDGFQQNNYEQPFGSTQHRFAQVGPSWFDSTRSRQYRVDFAITSQVTLHHMLKGGVQAQYSDLDHNMYSAWFEHLRGNFTYLWDRSPLNAGAYLQDQIEYRGMVANIGLRFDYYDPGGEWPTADAYSQQAFGSGSQLENMFARWDSLGMLEPVQTHLAISPRLGVSFPVTERSKFFFNYGHFRSLSPWHQMYIVRMRPRVGVQNVGNPNLAPPRTIAYETGVEYNLVDRYLIRIGGYLKDVTGQHGSVEYNDASGTVSYDSWQNNNYQDITGLELSITKTFGPWISGWANFDFRLTKSGFTGREEFFEDPSKAAVFGLYEGQESRFLPRPEFHANVRFHTPDDWGPPFMGIKPFGGWMLSVLPNWRKGPYFTWNPLGKFHVQDNVQWPDYHVWDMKLTKRLQAGNAHLQFYVDVENVFNQKISLFHRGYAFAGGGDLRDYLASLHLPMYDSDEFDDLRANSPEGFYEPGDDEPGDLRSSEKPYINDPNKSLWMFASPRDVWFGMVVTY